MKVNNHIELFSAQELEAIEGSKPEGISSDEVVSLFQSRGVKLSEATFRKYVQLGLLPTSRRVGRKGKHRGSQGLYPISVVRRINLIKRMMSQDMTLEEIGESFLSVQNEMENAQHALEKLFYELNARLMRLEPKRESTRLLSKDLTAAQKNAQSLLEKIEKIGSRLAIIGTTPILTKQGGPP